MGRGGRGDGGGGGGGGETDHHGGGGDGDGGRDWGHDEDGGAARHALAHSQLSMQSESHVAAQIWFMPLDSVKPAGTDQVEASPGKMPATTASSVALNSPAVKAHA